MEIESIPASSIQKQFWLAQQMNPKTPALNIPSGFWIYDDLNLTLLENALNILVSRHAIFRTVFEMKDQGLIQCVMPEIGIKLQINDISGRKVNDADINSFLNDEARRPFDLAKGPLLRAAVLKIHNNVHVLLITMHHIVTDLKTKDLFGREISEIYRYLMHSKEIPEVEAQSHQYGEYSRWQQQWIKGSEAREMLSYWFDDLQSASGITNLPFDHPRRTGQTLNGTAQKIFFKPALIKNLRNYAKACKVNLFLLLLTAYAVTVYRYTRQKDLVIGVPFTNRRNEKNKETYGCFVNILPIRIKFSDESTFIDVLKQIRLKMLGAHRHQEVALASIVERVQPVRDGSYNPLFQIGYTFEHPMKLTLVEAKTEQIHVHSGGSQIDLFLTLWEEGDGLKGFFEYNTDVFEPETIQRFTDNYLTLLNGIFDSPSCGITRMPFINECEREKILVDWNNTDVQYPKYRNLQALFEHQAAKTPDAIAVKYGEQKVTYSELNQRANMLAHYLKDHRVGPDIVVAIMMERSIEMVVAIYAVIKAGGAYLPLDPEFPAERLAYMLNDANIEITLSQSHLKLPDIDTKNIKINLDTEQERWEKYPDTDLRDTPSSHHLAYVIYTSGSTGKPKGVMNEHAGIINRLLWMQERYKLDTSDNVLQKTPYTFDVSVWEFFWPLMFGAQLTIAPPNSHKDPSHLIGLIVQEKITTLHFVPSMLRVFLQNKNVTLCKGVKRVFCSGEALSKDTHDDFFKKINAELHNLYGPTEAAVDVTFWQCDKESGSESIPIGRPVANTQIYILDEYLQPVPIGVPGEIHIGGVQVARGYLNQPLLTAEKFIPDPFTADNNHRLYKTGDLAKFLPNGNIDYLGRTDFQVKINGLRIELAEIENAISSYPEVKSAAAMSVEFDANDQRLVAYIDMSADTDHVEKRVVAKEDAGIKDHREKSLESQLRGYLKKILPDYMIPSIFVLVDEMPLSANGKLDRKALPFPEIQVETGIKNKEPRNEMEQMLLSLWSKYLKHDNIGMNDTFFDLGGTSLLSVQMSNELQTIMKKELSSVAVFEYPTIRDLAVYLSKNDATYKECDENNERYKKRRMALKKRRRAR